MGEYLSMIRNEKADPDRNISPDENFAREMMQLFSIGLVMLNDDGTAQLNVQGQTIPTYDQATINAFARVFTGWTYANTDNWYWPIPDSVSEVLPMLPVEQFHDTEEKTLLNGTVLDANQTAREDLEQALDNVFSHQNVAPFISKQLIQRLVTSNPSPQYVERVARVFNDNGNGSKGDLGAVVRAILLDDEARTGHLTHPETFGKLKEPILKVSAVMRAFQAQGMHSMTDDGVLSVLPAIRMYGSTRELGQRPYGAFSVFNFYRSNFIPSGPLRELGLYAPEFQILNDNVMTLMTNRFSSLAYSDKDDPHREQTYPRVWDTGNVNLDFTLEKTLVAQPQALIDRLNLLLMAGQMSVPMQQTLMTLMETIYLNYDLAVLHRVRAAVHLTLISPEFAVQH